MPDDTKPGAADLDKAQEVGEEILKELGLGGKPEVASRSTVEQQMEALAAGLQAADQKGDADEIRRLALRGKAFVQADREGMAKGRADLQDYLNEAIKESNNVETVRTRAELEAFDARGKDYQHYWQSFEKYFDDWLKVADAGAAPDLAKTQERVDEEERERAEGEGMTSVAVPESAPKSAEQTFNDTMTKIAYTEHEFNEAANRIVREAQVATRKAELDTSLATPKP